MATAAANGKALSFAYNESGIRTQKTVDGVTTEYYLDGSTVLAQKTGNNTVWYYYDCNGTREALEYGGQVYYYLYNAQGDVMALYDNDLNIVTEYTYDSWGKLLSVTGSLAETVGKANPFRYRGYYYDSETELYYLNSRYYDPETGRFINADGYVSTGQGTLAHNMYAYCGNSPIAFSDPSGDMALVDDLLVLLLIGAAIAACAVIGYITTTEPFKLMIAQLSESTSLMFSNIWSGISNVLLSKKKSKDSKKKRSTQHPSYENKGMVDYSLSAEENARRMMDNKWGKGNWKPGARRDFNKIKKWLTRDLKLKSFAVRDEDIFIIDGDLYILDSSGKGFGWINGIYYRRLD